MPTNPAGAESTRSVEPGGVTLRLSRVGALLLAGTLLAPWGVVVWWRLRDRPATGAPAASATPVSHLEGQTQRCKPGPWGELEYSRILIEPPAEFVPTRFSSPEPVRWVFKNATVESLGRLLATTPLTDQQRGELLAPERLELTGAGIVLKPTQELIFGLSPEAREALYHVLGETPENESQYRPSRIRAEMVDEWFADSGLSPATVALVKRLVYRRGGALLFSDQPSVLALLPTDAERTTLLKTLARKAALLVKLRVRPDSNIEALAQYWSWPGRAKDIEPLLRSLPKRPEGFTLDVAHLLPAFARARLYTYPRPRTDGDSVYRDCHWTSLNFFATTPDDRLADPQFVSQTLAQDYYPVPGDAHFGDVVLFLREDGTTKHSCVYVADEIVFTKNGGDPDIPWILMELSDLLPWYGVDGPVQLRAYRRRTD